MTIKNAVDKINIKATSKLLINLILQMTLTIIIYVKNKVRLSLVRETHKYTAITILLQSKQYRKLRIKYNSLYADYFYCADR